MSSDLEKKKVRQAVVIVNSFTRLMYPLNMDIPMGLLPLGNMRIIDYSMYWLTSQSLDEIIVCYSSHDKMIRDYFEEKNYYDARHADVRQSRYVSSPIITLHYLPSCKSTGDILRELDNLSVLTGESFLLVNAGAITNLNLAPVWQEHEARLKESSFNIMTSIFTHIPYTSNALRSRDLAMILNSDNRILAYNDLKKETLFPILTKSLLENDKASVRFDIAPAGIHLCSHEVVMHFSDNYDYKEMCEDYLQNEVNNIDFGYRYFAYFNDHTYSQFIVDLRTYRDVCSDVVRRLCYPTVPDNAIAGDRTVPYSRGDVYIHPTALLDYTTRVEHRSLVQACCTLGKATVLAETLLGAGCRIGEGCVLRGCVIGDDVEIGCGCVLSDCVIMSGTRIGDRVQLDRCTLGNDVVVKEGVALTGLRIHNSQRDMTDEEMDEVQWDEDDSLQVEEKGQGFILRSSSSATTSEAPRLKKWSHASLKNAQGFESEDDEEDEAVNGDREVYNGLLEYVHRLEQSDGNTLNDVYMEINCYRMAVNCQYDDIVRNLVRIMIDAVWHDGMTMDEWREGFQRIKKTMQVDGKLLHRFLIGDLTESSILEYAARYAVAHEGFIPFFGVFVQVLWDEQVVDDEAMMEWSDSVQNNEEESQFKVLLEEEAIKKILNYLQGSDDYDSDSGKWKRKRK
ncbi:hypothetical protein WA588_000357 [Blastocystis sp. NMH]